MKNSLCDQSAWIYLSLLTQDKTTQLGSKKLSKLSSNTGTSFMDMCYLSTIYLHIYCIW
jgi:hypothetical protein